MYSNSSALFSIMSFFCAPILYIFPLPSLLQPASPTSREAVYRTCTPDTPISPRRLARERAVVPSASEKTTVTRVRRREEGRRLFCWWGHKYVCVCVTSLFQHSLVDVCIWRGPCAAEAALFQGPHPVFCTANDRKLGGGLGTRLQLVWELHQMICSNPSVANESDKKKRIRVVL